MPLLTCSGLFSRKFDTERRNHVSFCLTTIKTFILSFAEMDMNRILFPPCFLPTTAFHFNKPNGFFLQLKRHPQTNESPVINFLKLKCCM